MPENLFTDGPVTSGQRQSIYWTWWLREEVKKVVEHFYIQHFKTDDEPADVPVVVISEE